MQPVGRAFIEQFVRDLVIIHRIKYDVASVEIEVAYIRLALDIEKGNKSQAARRLRIHRNTLDRKLAQYGIEINPPSSGGGLSTRMDGASSHAVGVRPFQPTAGVA